MEECISHIESLGYTYGKDIIGVKIKILPMNTNKSTFGFVFGPEEINVVYCEIVCRTAYPIDPGEPESLAWSDYGATGFCTVIKDDGIVEKLSYPPDNIYNGYIAQISVIFDDGTLNSAIESGEYIPGDNRLYS